MFDLLLRRARLVDDTLTDIAIHDGKIAALGEISAPSRKTIELNGKVYVSAGWIDSHVHCYPNSPIYHDEPDSVGIATGKMEPRIIAPRMAPPVIGFCQM